MAVKKGMPSEYPLLLGEIKKRIRTAQYEALRSVNKELISLYWDIGKMINERQRDKNWGKSVVEQLAKDLQVEFPGIWVFRPGTSGICGLSIFATARMKNCNHWLQKLDGRITLLLWRNAKTTFSVSFISA